METFQVLLFHEPLTIYAPRALTWKKQPLRVLSLFDGIGTGENIFFYKWLLLVSLCNYLYWLYRPNFKVW